MGTLPRCQAPRRVCSTPTQAEESPVEERELRRIEPQEEKPAGDETPSGEERPAGEESPAGEETRPEGEGEPS